MLGNFISGLGTQATLVALPYQIYVLSHSALLVGLLGAVELVPLIASALIGGAIADRMDRRKRYDSDDWVGSTALGVPAPGARETAPQS